MRKRQVLSNYDLRICYVVDLLSRYCKLFYGYAQPHIVEQSTIYVIPSYVF